VKAWERIPKKERIGWLVVVTALVVAVYGLLVYRPTSKALQHSEAMVLRKQDRIEKRTGGEVQPDANPNALRAELKRVEETKASLEARLDALGARFADSAAEGARQELLLAISTLAEGAGLRVRSLGPEGKADAAQSAPRLTDPVSGREYVRVRAQGGYWSLVDFLDGLPRLGALSAVLGLELQVVEPPPGDGVPSPPPDTLDLTFDLSL